MPIKRYGRALETLIERYGEDVSLAQALQRERNPKAGAPPISNSMALEFLIYIELAVDAGYQVRPACRLVANYRGDLSDRPGDLARYRYLQGRKFFGLLLNEHRAEILRNYAKNDFKAWFAYLRAHPASK